MTGANFLAFIIGMFIEYALVYIGVKTNERLNGIKKKLENKEPLVFDGVDDFCQVRRKGIERLHCYQRRKLVSRKKT